MKTRNFIVLLSLCCAAVTAVPLYANDDDVKQEVRKLRAEAAYQEMKGNLEQSLKLFEESLELMPNTAIEEKVVKLKVELGLIEVETQTEPPPEVESTEAPTVENTPSDSEPPETDTPEIPSEAEPTEPTPAAEPTEPTPAAEPPEPTPEAEPPEPTAFPSALAFTPVSTAMDWVEGYIGTADRKKTDTLGTSQDLRTIVWDQEQEVDDHDFSELYVNGNKLELPAEVRYFGFVRVNNQHEFVANASLNIEGEGPDEALVVNGALIGNYYDVEYPTLSEDGSAWASALISRTEHESGTEGWYDYHSTLLVNGEIRAEVPYRVKKIRLSRDGQRLAYTVEVEHGEDGEPNQYQRVYMEGNAVGPKVKTCYDMIWDPKGAHLYWDAEALPDETGYTQRLLVKDGEILSTSFVNLDDLVFAENTDDVAFVENTDEGYHLVINGDRTGPWQHVDDLTMNADGKLAFTGEKDGVTRIYIDGKAVGPELPNWYAVRDLEWSPDGEHWAADATVAEDQKIVLLDGREQLTITNAGGHVFSPDSKRLASWTRDENKNYAILLDGELGPSFRRYETSMPILFSPDSKHLFYWALNDDKQLKLYRNHEMVPSEGEIAPQLYFDDEGNTWYIEIIGDEIGEFYLKRL